MAFEKINALYYLADTKEDLQDILKLKNQIRTLKKYIQRFRQSIAETNLKFVI